MVEVAGVTGTSSSAVEGGVSMSLLLVEDRLEEDMVAFEEEPIKRVAVVEDNIPNRGTWFTAQWKSLIHMHEYKVHHSHL